MVTMTFGKLELMMTSPLSACPLWFTGHWFSDVCLSPFIAAHVLPGAAFVCTLPALPSFTLAPLPATGGVSHGRPWELSPFLLPGALPSPVASGTGAYRSGMCCLCRCVPLTPPPWPRCASPQGISLPPSWFQSPVPSLSQCVCSCLLIV